MKPSGPKFTRFGYILNFFFDNLGEYFCILNSNFLLRNLSLFVNKILLFQQLLNALPRASLHYILNSAFQLADKIVELIPCAHLFFLLLNLLSQHISISTFGTLYFGSILFCFLLFLEDVLDKLFNVALQFLHTLFQMHKNTLLLRVINQLDVDLLIFFNQLLCLLDVPFLYFSQINLIFLLNILFVQCFQLFVFLLFLQESFSVVLQSKKELVVLLDFPFNVDDFFFDVIIFA